jgi:hypothetical protein
MTLPDHKIGYKGQHYEVRANTSKEDGDREMTIGWSSTRVGVEGLIRGVNAHPSWHNPKVIDLRTNLEVSPQDIPEISQ